jgi:L-lysine exporter family protein LysE/ArgO
MNIFVQGLLLQASLILALGAQNIFVLNSGLRRERHLFVATICAVCDTFLTLFGVIGAASLFVQIPSLKTVFGILGVTFLLYNG